MLNSGVKLSWSNVWATVVRVNISSIFILVGCKIARADLSGDQVSRKPKNSSTLRRVRALGRFIAVSGHFSDPFPVGAIRLSNRIAVCRRNTRCPIAVHCFIYTIVLVSVTLIPACLIWLRHSTGRNKRTSIHADQSVGQIIGVLHQASTIFMLCVLRYRSDEHI